MKKYIVSRPDIMGGAPCIVGTRIPVEVILYCLKEGVNLKELHKMYPWVELKKFEGVREEVTAVFVNKSYLLKERYRKSRNIKQSNAMP